MSRIIIGVDVSRDTLDVHVRPTNVNRRFANTAAGIAELVAWTQTHKPERIVFESTGPYQKAAVGALLAQGLPAVVVNARQVRDFAKALGKLAKTDAVDAALIAHFGEVVPTDVRPLESPNLSELRGLYDRRGQLIRMLAAEKNHRHAAASGSPKVLARFSARCIGVIPTCSVKGGAMHTPISEVVAWLLGQLSSVPPNIRAVYVEWDQSYLEPNTPREVKLVCMDAFGFEDLAKGSFDCSNRDDLYKLGDFVWEGERGLSLRKADYPEADWTEVLKDAAAAPELRALTRSRNLLLLVGQHDDAVYDVS
jgi:hypothetical protein